MLHFLTLRSMMRGVLFIYGHALSVCVGLSNIHLSCAAVIKSLIPSHIQRMKHEHWSRCPRVWIPTSASQQSEGERGFVQLSDKLQTGQIQSFSFSFSFFPPPYFFSFCSRSLFSGSAPQDRLLQKSDGSVKQRCFIPALLLNLVSPIYTKVGLMARRVI